VTLRRIYMSTESHFYRRMGGGFHYTFCLTPTSSVSDLAGFETFDFSPVSLPGNSNNELA
jgi:hypothetical protein